MLTEKQFFNGIEKDLPNKYWVMMRLKASQPT